MSVKLVMLYNGQQVDVTNLATSITWSGDINTMPRTLAVTLQNSANLSTGKRIFAFDCGALAMLFYNNQEIFRGTVFQRQIDQSGNESFTAYDQLIYATKSQATMLVQGQTVSQIVTELCNRFGIKTGTIEKTTYALPKTVYTAQTLSAIWTDIMGQDNAVTGNMYCFRCVNGITSFYSRQNAAQTSITTDNLITGNTSVSIEELRNFIVVEKGSLNPTKKGKVSYDGQIAQDKASIAQYGLLSNYESPVDTSATPAQMQLQANQVLASLNAPVILSEITFEGNPECITGNAIDVYETLTNIAGTFFITSDSHTWQNGNYQMDLQISKDVDLQKKIRNTKTNGGKWKWV